MPAARVARSPSRERESEVTRRSIVDAAEELLANGGEKQLSIRELCLRAGVTPPTIYHHFGDKGALVDRVIDECFSAFDESFADRKAPQDSVERLRWEFDRYVEYGLAHPTHYRLMFVRGPRRTSARGVASYDRLRSKVRAVEAAGRLRAPLEAATAAFWSSAHGVTSLVIAGFWQPDSPAIALVRDSMIAQLTVEGHRRKRGQRKRRSP